MTVSQAIEKLKQMIELEMAGYMGRLGHYIADAAMPLHVSIHHDGWVGPNPNEYTRDPRVHGRFESQFVELIDLKESDFKPMMKPARQIADPWQAILDHIAMSFSHVEEVYKLDKAGAYTQKDHEQARLQTDGRIERPAAGSHPHGMARIRPNAPDDPRQLRPQAQPNQPR